MRTKLLADAYKVCVTRLESRGVLLEAITDYSKVGEIIDILGKPYLTPELSPFQNDFCEGNCFWLVAQKAGRVIATGGARFDDLGDEPVSSYWRRCAQRHYSQGNAPPIMKVDPQIDSRIHGKLAYFGDLYSLPGAKSLHVVEQMTMAGQLLAALKWNPDFTYAWIRRRDVRRGAHARYGFLNYLPNVRRWSDPPTPRTNLETLAYTSNKDVSFLAADLIDDYSSMQ